MTCRHVSDIASKVTDVGDPWRRLATHWERPHFKTATSWCYPLPRKWKDCEVFNKSVNIREIEGCGALDSQISRVYSVSGYKLGKRLHNHQISTL